MQWPPLVFRIQPGNIVGKPLRGLSYDVTIHTVGPCTDHTAETGRTKFKVLIKTFFDFLFIICNTFQLCLGFFVKVR